MKNKRVLVTGANGMLGCSLVPYLIQYGYIVGKSGTSNTSEYTADLSVEIDAYNVFDKFKPDVIVNLAAYTDVDGCEKHPNIAYAVNTFIVKNITSWIKKTSSKCILVQLSTDHVYNNIGPHKENNVNILNHYASSKFAGELFASRVNSVILRTNFFGISKKKGRCSFSDWIVSSLTNKEHIQVFNNVLFNPLLINRLLVVIKMTIEKGGGGGGGGGSKIPFYG